MARSSTAARPAPLRKTRLLIATRKGLWTLTERHRAQRLGLGGAAVSRPHRSPRRSSIRATARAASPQRAPDTLARRSSARGQRTHLEGSHAAARIRRGQRPRGRSHVLAHAGTRMRARRLVRGHVAAGTVPFGGWRRDVGRRGGIQCASATQGVVRRRPGRHAGRTETALDPGRSARSCAHVHRDVERRRVRDRPMRGSALAAAEQGRAGGLPAGSRHRSSATIRIACALRAATRIGSISRIIAAFIGSIGPATRGTTSAAAMPKSVGYVGLPLVVHPRDPDTLWVFPMDGTSVWPRTAPGGRPAVYRSRDGGKTWKRQDQGMPKAQAWWTVKRQAMTTDAREPAGIYFGTTSR